MRLYTAGVNQAGQRLDKLLRKLLPQAGNGFIYRMLRKKNITLNGARASGSEIVSPGDAIRLWLSDETIDRFSAREEEEKAPSLEQSRIVYEDADILLYDKPAGLLSQKAAASDISASEMLVEYLKRKNGSSPDDQIGFRPSFCNRLDRNTSGLLIGGKSLAGLQDMSRMLKERTLHKDYLAVAEGKMTEAAELKGYLIKDERTNKVRISKEGPGDYVHTEIRPVFYDGVRSLLMVRLHTGKPHQIRAHLASTGHPITGDVKYGACVSGGDRKNGVLRQLLHAYRLTFPDGRSFTAPVPEDMKKAVRGYQWEEGKPEDFEDLSLRI